MATPRRRKTDSSLLQRLLAEARPRFIAGLAIAAVTGAANYGIRQHQRLDEVVRASQANAEAIHQLQLDLQRIAGGRKP